MSNATVTLDSSSATGAQGSLDVNTILLIVSLVTQPLWQLLSMFVSGFLAQIKQSSCCGASMQREVQHEPTVGGGVPTITVAHAPTDVTVTPNLSPRVSPLDPTSHGSPARG
jgi:hypothetical protein